MAAANAFTGADAEEMKQREEGLASIEVKAEADSDGLTPGDSAAGSTGAVYRPDDAGELDTGDLEADYRPTSTSRSRSKSNSNKMRPGLAHVAEAGQGSQQAGFDLGPDRDVQEQLDQEDPNLLNSQRTPKPTTV